MLALIRASQEECRWVRFPPSALIIKRLPNKPLTDGRLRRTALNGKTLGGRTLTEDLAQIP